MIFYPCKNHGLICDEFLKSEIFTFQEFVTGKAVQIDDEKSSKLLF